MSKTHKTPQQDAALKDAPKKIRECACLLIFFGEVAGHAQADAGYSTFTIEEEAVEGFAYFCTKLGYDLLELLK